MERKTASEFPPTWPQTTNSERDWIHHHRKHWKKDIEAVASTRPEKVCFSLPVEKEVEVTRKSLNDK